MTHIRVLPRDAFNDANLLKCIGLLTLAELDGQTKLKYEYDGAPFEIVQDDHDCITYVSNITFFTPNGTKLEHFRPINSRDAFPIYFKVGDEEVPAFDDRGKPAFRFSKLGNIIKQEYAPQKPKHASNVIFEDAYRLVYIEGQTLITYCEGDLMTTYCATSEQLQQEVNSAKDFYDNE